MSTKFQKRHYNVIARVIADVIREIEESGETQRIINQRDCAVRRLQHILAAEFARDNAQFDVGRFTAACNPTE